MLEHNDYNKLVIQQNVIAQRSHENDIRIGYMTIDVYVIFLSQVSA
jgi:hypothetical protein